MADERNTSVDLVFTPSTYSTRVPFNALFNFEIWRTRRIISAVNTGVRFLARNCLTDTSVTSVDPTVVFPQIGPLLVMMSIKQSVLEVPNPSSRHYTLDIEKYDQRGLSRQLPRDPHEIVSTDRKLSDRRFPELR